MSPRKTTRRTKTSASTSTTISLWPSWKERPLFSLLLSLLMVTLVTLLGTASVWAILTATGIDDPLTSDRLVTVEGDGSVTVKPDKATLNVGVESEGESVAAAQTANSAVTNQLTERIKALGIPEEDVQTTYYNVYEDEVYNPETEQWETVGWIVAQDITITINDITLVSQVISAAGQGGATNVYGLNFSAEETSDLVQQARAEAIAEAEAHIAQIASSLDVKIDDVYDYYEWTSSGGGQYPYYSDRAFALEEVALDSFAPEIESGSEEITVGVSITYKLK